MQNFRNPKTGEVIESGLTDEEVAERLSKKNAPFAQSLYITRWRWSESQRFWAHKLANEIQTVKPKSEFRTLYEALKPMFDKAAERLKYPRVTFNFPDFVIKFSVAGKGAAVPGSITVTLNGMWMGRLTLDGLTTSKNCGDDCIKWLEEFSKNPVKVIIDYGKSSGFCCFCNTRLTDSRSVSVGYGPICAEHYRLPWGNRPQPQRVESQLWNDEGQWTTEKEEEIDDDDPF